MSTHVANVSKQIIDKELERQTVFQERLIYRYIGTKILAYINIYFFSYPFVVYDIIHVNIANLVLKVLLKLNTAIGLLDILPSCASISSHCFATDAVNEGYQMPNEGHKLMDAST